MELLLSIHIAKKIGKNDIKTWERVILGMQQYNIRTDLALEATESVKLHKKEEITGVNLEEYDVLEGVHITKVVITTKNASKSLGKPIGTYITLEAACLEESDEDYHRSISEQLARLIRSVLPDITQEKSILVVGLGNRDVTADALGPCTVDNLFINRNCEFPAKEIN